MPKAMLYTKGSIIYFEGDHDERIFIMQKGTVLLSSTDIETGQPIVEQIKSGEFFGVKSALGHFTREETATVLVPTVAVALTIAEFENLFYNNQQYRSCYDIYLKFLKRYPDTPQKEEIAKLYSESKLKAQKMSMKQNLSEKTENTDINTNVLKLFNLPDRKSTRLNSSHQINSYAVFCL